MFISQTFKLQYIWKGEQIRPVKSTVVLSKRVSWFELLPKIISKTFSLASFEQPYDYIFCELLLHRDEQITCHRQAS